MRPAPPGPSLGLAQETTSAGRGQNGEREQAQHEPRQLAGQIRVFAHQDAKNDQYGTQAEGYRRRRTQYDSDQNRERTPIFRLVYTWPAAWARLALDCSGPVKSTGEPIR